MFLFPLGDVLEAEPLDHRIDIYLTLEETTDFLKWFHKSNQANASSSSVEIKL